MILCSECGHHAPHSPVALWSIRPVRSWKPHTRQVSREDAHFTEWGSDIPYEVNPMNQTTTTRNLKIPVLKSSNPIAQRKHMFQERNLPQPSVQPGALTRSRPPKMHLLAEKSKFYIVSQSGSHMVTQGKNKYMCSHVKTKGFSHWAFIAVNNSNRNKHLTKKETEAIPLTQVTWQPCRGLCSFYSTRWGSRKQTWAHQRTSKETP